MGLDNVPSAHHVSGSELLACLKSKDTHFGGTPSPVDWVVGSTTGPPMLPCLSHRYLNEFKPVKRMFVLPRRSRYCTRWSVD